MEIKKIFSGKKSFWWLLVFFAGIPLFLALNFHSRSGVFNYHSEIFSDKAGYYIYLPSTFIYNFDANAFPDSIDHKTGHGFKINKKRGKIITKYSSGVSVMQSPFFFVAHLTAPLFGYKSDGFTLPYHKAIDIATVFYLFFGIYFLQKYLRYYINDKFFIGIALLFLLYGTNLLFYATQETGMSHVYSFFLFSILIYYWKRILVSEKTKLKHIIIVSFASGLLILVRQTNLLFLPFVFLLDLKSLPEIKDRFLKVYKYLPIIVFIVILCVLPQIFYYLYLTGKPLMYSYGKESFIYKFSPKILRVWFACENGFFTYNPIHFFTIAGIFWMMSRSITNGRILLVLFLCITYLNAAWWSPMLGCGFGHRGFVEFYPFFALPILYIIYRLLHDGSKNAKIISLVTLFLCVYYNIRIGLRYDGCWYGNGPWDYNELIRFVSKALIPF